MSKKLSKKERATLYALLLRLLWRCLPHSEYGNKLWTLNDIAVIINKEVGTDESWAVTAQHLVGATSVRSNRTDKDGDDFDLHYKPGFFNPYRRSKAHVEPLFGTKRAIAVGGKAVAMVGWSCSNASQCPVGEISAVSEKKMLKVGEAEGDQELVAELKAILVGNEQNMDPNGGESTAMASASTAAAATSGSSDTTSDAGGTGTGTGGGRTPPPPSTGSEATRRISPTEPTDQVPTTAGRKRPRPANSSVGTTLQSHVYCGGKYYCVTDEAVPALLDLLKKYECEEISPPYEVDGGVSGDDEGSDGADGPNAKPLKFQRVGKGAKASHHLIPTSHHLIRESDNNDLIRLRKLEAAVRLQLFSVGGGDRFNGSSHQRRFIALGAISAPKASGEVIEMLCCVVRAGIALDLLEAGLKVPKDYTLAHVAQASPGKTSVRRWAVDLGADITVLNLNRIKDAKPEMLCLVGDGGHRGGIEHYPKLMTLYEDSTERVIAISLDNLSCGKKASDIARAIAHSVEQYASIAPFGAFTTDSGGGGNVDKVGAELLKLEVLEEGATLVACTMHAWQKPFDRAVNAAMGAGGLGRRTLLQLTIACWYLMKKVGLSQFKKVWKEVAQHVAGSLDEKAYEEERRMFAGAFEAFEDAVKDGLLDGLSNFKAISRAVLTRWIYVNSAVEHLMNNWLMWYFVARAIKNSYASDTETGKIARGILSLQRQRPSADPSEPPEAFSYDDDFDLDDVDLGEGYEDPFANSPPQLYVQGKFLITFSKECFVPFYHALMRIEPRAKRHAAMCPHLPLFKTMAHFKIQQCKKWRTDPAWASFRDLANQLPKCNNDLGRGGQEHAYKMADVFLQEFDNNFVKHWTRYTSPTHLHFILHSLDELAIGLAKYLVNGQDVDGDNYVATFEHQIITLPPIVKIYDDVAEINAKFYLGHMTDGLNVQDVLANRFISKNFGSIEQMVLKGKPAAAIGDAAFLRRCNHQILAVPSHQQEVEAMVNEGGYAAATNRDQAMRSVYLTCRTNILHPLNQEVREEANEARRQKNAAAAAAAAAGSTRTGATNAADSSSSGSTATSTATDTSGGSDGTDGAGDDGAGNETTDRLWGSSKTGPLLNKFSEFSKKADAAKRADRPRWKEIRNSLTDKSKFVSAADEEDELAKIVANQDKDAKMTAIEMESNIDITAKVGGLVILSQIQVSKNHHDHLDAEIELRGIRVFKNKEGVTKDIGSCSFVEKRHALRRHEIGRLKSERNITIDNETDLKAVMPLSDKLKELL